MDSSGREGQLAARYSVYFSTTTGRASRLFGANIFCADVFEQRLELIDFLTRFRFNTE